VGVCAITSHNLLSFDSCQAVGAEHAVEPFCHELFRSFNEIVDELRVVREVSFGHLDAYVFEVAHQRYFSIWTGQRNKAGKRLPKLMWMKILISGQPCSFSKFRQQITSLTNSDWPLRMTLCVEEIRLAVLRRDRSKHFDSGSHRVLRFVPSRHPTRRARRRRCDERRESNERDFTGRRPEGQT
jgi:hypothetical protein